MQRRGSKLRLQGGGAALEALGGLSDAGAHLGYLCDAEFGSTSLVSEEDIRGLISRQADLYAIPDWGGSGRRLAALLRFERTTVGGSQARGGRRSAGDTAPA